MTRSSDENTSPEQSAPCPYEAPIFTRESIRLFWYELRSKFRGGVRSPAGFIYISLTLIGVAWASWGIPSINNSQTSPETLGIYVIGFLITVMLDAIITWKKKGNDNYSEQTIAGLFIVLSLLLTIAASVLSLKTVHIGTDNTRIENWKSGATPLLFSILIGAIAMSLVLTGIDPRLPRIGSLDVSVDAVRDRK